MILNSPKASNGSFSTILKILKNIIKIFSLVTLHKYFLHYFTA